MRRTASSVRFFLLAVLLALASPALAQPTGTRPMFLETLRIVTDWLNDSTYGVNAMLTTLPHDAGDTIPAVQLIVDETRNGIAARERFPTGSQPGPVITVHMTKPADVHTALDDAVRDVPDMPVSIRYGDTSQVASENGTKNALYTMRAILKSIKQLMAAPGVSARVRNLVELANVQDQVTVVPVFADNEDKIITGGLIFHFYVRDKAP